MPYKLVIAEKPMLARDIAGAVCGTKVTERTKLPISGNGYTVCACFGHMLELVEPAELDERWGKPWSEEVLPIAPKPWPKKVAKGKEAAVAEIAELLEGCESVIHAGDPDDEGQLIVDELLEHLGYTGKVERVYVNDSIAKNITRAFGQLKDNRECEGAGKAALARQLADMCFGVSESRLATMRCHAPRLLTVGRVQTPTLGLVVARDEAIANHTKTKYYEGIIRVEVEGQTLAFKWIAPDEAKGDGKHVLDRSLAEAAAASMVGQDAEFEAVASTKTTQPPLPYNLTALQAEMSRRFGMTPARTLDVTQSLRDNHKAITYNRSDSQYLKDEHFEQAPEVMAAACANLGESWPLDFTIKSRAFNEAKVSAHHGIIPQEARFDVAALSTDEKRVYKAIVERYACQFAQPKTTSITTSQLACRQGGGVFRCVCQRTIDPGWTALFSSEADASDEESADSPAWLEPGRHRGHVEGWDVEERETTPPKPYTEGTLVKDMSSIARYVTDPEVKRILLAKDEGKEGEHGGIGTTATRAAIIEKLKKVGYLEVSGKAIRSTELGRAFYRLLPEGIGKADTTARWQLIQERVAAGELPVTAVMDDVCEVFEGHRESAYRGVDLSGASRKVVGKCPLCSADVIDKGPKAKKVSCSSNKWSKDDAGEWQLESGCGFQMWKTVFGKKLTDRQLGDLLAKGRTSAPVKGLKGRSGKAFDAYITLEDPATGKTGVEFASAKPQGAKGKGKRW